MCLQTDFSTACDHLRVGSEGTRVYKDRNGKIVKAENGFYDSKDSAIHIDLNAGSYGRGSVLFTVAHELTHFIQDWSPKHYKQLCNILMKGYAAKGQSVDELVANQQAFAKEHGRELSWEEAYDEAIADSMESILADGKVMELMRDIEAVDQTLGEKVKQFFRDICDLLKRTIQAYSNVKPDSAEGRMVQGMQEIYDQLQQLFAEGLYEGGDNYRKAEKNTTAEGSEGKYSLREFEDGIRFVDVQMDVHIFDGMTVSEMNKAVKPILMDKFAGKVIGIDNRAFVNGDSVNEYLHPSKSIDISTRQAKLTAAGELDNLLDAGKALPNRPDGEDGHIHPDAIDFSYFQTIFKVGDEYFEGIVNIKNNKRGKLLKDITKIKNITQDIVSSYGNNPKSNFLRDASMDSIRNPNEIVKENDSAKSDTVKLSARKGETAEKASPVKLKFNYVTETQQFRRWFGDWQNRPENASKIVDADGTPKVMYHGSPAQFTIFDKKKARSSGAYGSGFYFTDSQSHASTYGQQYSVYLNIRNPLQ